MVKSVMSSGLKLLGSFPKVAVGNPNSTRRVSSTGMLGPFFGLKFSEGYMYQILPISNFNLTAFAHGHLALEY